MTELRRQSRYSVSQVQTPPALSIKKFIISIVMRTIFHGGRTAIALEDRARLKPFKSRHMTPGPHGFWSSPDRFWS